MDTQLLDAIRNIIREEVQTIVGAEFQKRDKELQSRFKSQDNKLTSMSYQLQSQDDKLDAILEAWDIQKVHRQELDDHEDRIQTIERRIPTIS